MQQAGAGETGARLFVLPRRTATRVRNLARGRTAHPGLRAYNPLRTYASLPFPPLLRGDQGGFFIRQGAPRSRRVNPPPRPHRGRNATQDAGMRAFTNHRDALDPFCGTLTGFLNTPDWFPTRGALRHPGLNRATPLALRRPTRGWVFDGGSCLRVATPMALRWLTQHQVFGRHLAARVATPMALRWATQHQVFGRHFAARVATPLVLTWPAREGGAAPRSLPVVLTALRL